MKLLFLSLASWLLLSSCTLAKKTISYHESDAPFLDELTCLIDSVNVLLENQDSASYEQMMDEWFR